MVDRRDRISGKKRAAAIIVGLGTENAAQVYKYLKEDEIETLTIEVAMLQAIEPEMSEEIFNEFYELCLAQKFLTEGGIDYAKDILEKAFGNQHAVQLLDRVTQSLQSRAFDFLKKADPKHLLSFLQHEHPQTIALILSYAKPEQASAILSELSRDKQIDVAARIARMDRTSPEIIKEVERTFEKKFASLVTTDFTEIGGVKNMAEILNSVDRSTEKFILDELNKKEPELAESIRRRMFVFEDIVMLDDMAIQRVLRQVENKDLMIALKGANTEVTTIIFNNMPKRVSDALKEDMQYMRAVRFRDVEEAQQHIVAVIRKLEEQGEIIISRGGKDDLIV